jgi:phosphoribosyl 1,2-cyclic phosphate phosphodiesterase
MKITFLGTGTSQGIPLIGCNCAVCTSENPKDNRLRSSILVEFNGNTVVIDTGPDFRQQMLRNQVKNLDAVLFTHEHKDHTAGLDDVRAYNYFQKKHMDVYASKYVIEALHREFAYIFAQKKYPGVPVLKIHEITNEPFSILEQVFVPIEVKHFKLPVFGYRIDDFCYITDANAIAPEELHKMKGAKIVVLNALRREKHLSHFTLDQAIEIINIIQPEMAYFTHISHQLGLHEAVSQELPSHIKLAHDGLVLEI